MKLKSVLCALAIAATVPLFADQTSSNICGWMKVTSNLRNTIIGVPWVAVNGENDAAVKVAKLVKTDNLTQGDKLYLYDAANNTWFARTLGETGWAADTTVTIDKAVVGTPAEDQALPRGQALILERQNVTAPFYLFGQYTTSAVASQTVQAGTAEAPVMMLLANPLPAAFDLNSGKITNAGETDTIVVPQNDGAQTIYSLKNGKWGYYKKVTIEKFGLTMTQNQWCEAEPLPMGTGFWYVSRGGAATIAW